MFIIKNIALLLSIFLFLNQAIIAQKVEIGRPIVRNYSPKEYKAHSQIWEVIQDNRGIMYMTNTDGFIEFDGNNWTVIPNLNLKSVDINHNNIIYTAGSNLFGCLKPNKSGTLEYLPLTNLFSKEDFELLDIRYTHCVGDSVVLNNKNALFVYYKNKITKIPASSKFGFSYKIGHRIYVQEQGMGLFFLGNGKKNKLEFFSKIFEKTGMLNFISMLEVSKDTYLMPTREGEIVRVNLKTQDYELIKNAELSSFFKSGLLYSAAKINNHLFAFGTLLNGLVLTDENLNIKSIINKSNGLISNSIISLYADNSENLWISTQEGLSYVETSSAFSIVGDGNNLDGVLTDASIFDSTLTVTTTNGAYWIKMQDFSKGKIPTFTKFPEITSQTWQSAILRNKQYISNINGIYAVCGNSVSRIYDENTNQWFVKEYKKNPNYALVGTNNGLRVFTFEKNNQLKFSHFLDGYNSQTRWTAEDKNGNIWITTQKGEIKKLIVNEDLAKIVNTISYDTKSGLPSTDKNYIYNFNEKIVAGTINGLYCYNPKTDKFDKDINLNKQIKNKDIWCISPYKNSIYFTGNIYNGLVEYNTNTENYIKNPFVRISAGTNYGINANDDDYTFFCVENSLMVFKKNQKKNYNKSYNCLIRKVENISTDSIRTIFGGVYFYNNKILKEQPSELICKLPFIHNSIRFNFAAPFFDESDKNQFSYKLVGFDKNWSEWTSINFKEYTNLYEGEYEFLVKAKNIYGNESTAASYKFVIEKPWYRTFLAYAIYIILIIIALYILLRLNSRRLKHANIKLEGIVRERTAEIYQQKEEIQAQAEMLEMSNIELEKLSIVASETVNSVIIANSNMEIEWVNDGFTRMLGYTMQEFCDKYGNTIVGASANNNVIESINECIHKRESVEYVAENITKSGDKIWVQTTLTPIFDLNDNLKKLIAIDSNITPIKNAEREISIKNTQITDSISYAKRIQQAILPSKEYFDKIFADSFVYFKPRDIVSGDFFYLTKHNDFVFVAVADCTGHGVPGAFMSMIGYSSLNNIIKSKNITAPKDILQDLHQSIYQSLHQNNGDIKSQDDGMDISLICFDLQNNRACISGANHTPFVLFENEVTQFKTSCFSIGEPRAYKKGLEFLQTEIELKKGQRFFLFSDGFQDQFGGAENKKFQKHNLISILTTDIKMIEYPDLLQNSYNSWTSIGNITHPQLDDIIILGIEI